jgi:hypothetical protein
MRETPADALFLALRGCAVLCSAQALGDAAQDYEQFYVPELQAKQQAKAEQERARQEKQLAKLRQDMASKAAISTGGAAAAAAAGAAGSSGLSQQQQQQGEGHEDEEDGESADLELSDDSIEGSVGAASD